MNDEWMKSYLLKVNKTVEEHGWLVQGVGSEGEFPQFAYTIGLTKTFNHPEVAIVGLSFDTMVSVLNRIGDLVRKGQKFEHGSTSSILLRDGYTCRFLKAECNYGEWFGIGCRFYKHEPFVALQCVWPDRDHKFPWDADVASGMTKLQPLLGTAPEMNYIMGDELIVDTVLIDAEPELKCNVCGAPAIGVCCGSCGPISFAYCKECLEFGAEPYWALVAYLGCGGITKPEDVRKEYQATIEATCKKADKTEDEFWKDCREGYEQMCKDMDAESSDV